MLCKHIELTIYPAFRPKYVTNKQDFENTGPIESTQATFGRLIPENRYAEP